MVVEKHGHRRKLLPPGFLDTSANHYTSQSTSSKFLEPESDPITTPARLSEEYTSFRWSNH